MPIQRQGWAMNYERLEEVKVAPLESGFIVTRAFRDEYDECDKHRTAEPTLYGAITLAARALGYRGLIRFEPEPESRTVEVPIVSHVDHKAQKAQFSEANALIERQIAVSTTGPAFDLPEVFDDEVALNHGTAVGDKL